MKKVDPLSPIKEIRFDLVLAGKLYKDLVLDYTPEHDWCLTLADIHDEDNDSWNCIDVGDAVYDFQFYGEDDSLCEDENGEYSPELAVKTPLHCQMNRMVKDGEQDCYNHTDEWLSSCTGDFVMKGLRAILTDGTEVKLKLSK